MPDEQWWDDLNHDFETHPVVDAPPEPMLWAGGVVCVAGVVGQDTPIGPQPVVIFRFVAADGSFMTPIALVGDTALMDRLHNIVGDAANAAVKAANAMRGKT